MSPFHILKVLHAKRINENRQTNKQQEQQQQMIVNHHSFTIKQIPA